MRFVKIFALGLMLAAASTLHAQAQAARDVQAKAASAASAANATQSTKPVAQAPAKPAASAPSAQTKPAGTAAKTATAKGKSQGGKKAAKAGAPKQSAKKPAAKPANPAANATKESETRVARRDPFESMIGRGNTGGAPTGPLPPGKAGLQVSTLRLDGIVRAPTGMIAVVSNPQARTYFLREGDQLYDGRVEKIAMDGVSFHEVGKDAFGKPVERQVNKRIYASAGEQQ